MVQTEDEIGDWPLPRAGEQDLLDAALILRRVARQVSDAVAEHQRPDQGGEQQHADPQERRAQRGGFYGSWHVTTSANTG